MKKIISVLLLLTLILPILTSCDDATTPKSEKIEMPHSSTDYIGDEYTLESLTEHFRELGFTSFENIPCDPNNDNFRNNIFVIEICTDAICNYLNAVFFRLSLDLSRVIKLLFLCGVLTR